MCSLSPATTPPAKGKPVLLGDVVLAYETVAREAKEQHKHLADHLRHLVIHGVLHLFGYDHMQGRAGEAHGSARDTHPRFARRRRSLSHARKSRVVAETDHTQEPDEGPLSGLAPMAAAIARRAGAGAKACARRWSRCLASRTTRQPIDPHERTLLVNILKLHEPRRFRYHGAARRYHGARYRDVFCRGRQADDRGRSFARAGVPRDAR